jgi:hypothetical protein
VRLGGDFGADVEAIFCACHYAIEQADAREDRRGAGLEGNDAVGGEVHLIADWRWQMANVKWQKQKQKAHHGFTRIFTDQKRQNKDPFDECSAL